MASALRIRVLMHFAPLLAIPLLLALKKVASSMDRYDVLRSLRMRLDLLSQALNVDAKCIGGDLLVVRADDPLRELLRTDHAPRVRHQVVEKAHFVRRHMLPSIPGQIDLEARQR
jgi:hypothetical protein